MISRTSQCITKNNTNPIPIPVKNQYSLKQNFFDPTKSSPPNQFMIKLHNRIIKYESSPLLQK